MPECWTAFDLGLETVSAYAMLCLVAGTWGRFQRPFTVDTVTVLLPNEVAETLAGRAHFISTL